MKVKMLTHSYQKEDKVTKKEFLPWSPSQQEIPRRLARPAHWRKLQIMTRAQPETKEEVHQFSRIKKMSANTKM